MTPDTPCFITLLYGAKPTFQGRFIGDVYSGGERFRHVWVNEWKKEKWYRAGDVELKRRKSCR